MRRPRLRTAATTTILGTALGASLLAGALTAPATADAGGVGSAATPDITWGACATGAPAGFQCASVEVPTDYDDPSGPTTTIALTRLPATDQAQRKGSLFFNFGGPGGPGVPSLQALADRVVTPAVRAQYDLVSFDPRGIGQSDPVVCYDSPEQESAALADTPAFPQTSAETRRYLQQNRDLALNCRARSADRIQHASSANVARDMELLRRAVGDDRLNYVGYSYGTLLGATYSRLFPSQVGRFVLDGTLDPVKWSGSDGDPRTLGSRIGQGPAASEVFGQFLRECRLAGDRCALNALGNPRDVVDRLWESLKRNPVVDGSGEERVVYTYPLVVALSFQQLYSPATFEPLADFLAALARTTEQGPTTRRAPVEPTLPRLQEYSGIGDLLATLCVDTPLRPRPEEFARYAAIDDRKAPGFGAFRAWIGIQCPYMGLTDDDAFRGPWKQTTRSTVLVIGTRHDPATPYAFTKPYADRFPSARMLTVEGYGHTIVGVSTCADGVVERYLVGGVPPRDGARCDQSVKPFTDVAPGTGLTALMR